MYSSTNSFCREHFLLVNGMSNKYWGWGLEDDEFYVRLKEAGLNVTRPQNLSTDVQSTFKWVNLFFLNSSSNQHILTNLNWLNYLLPIILDATNFCIEQIIFCISDTYMIEIIAKETWPSVTIKERWLENAIVKLDWIMCLTS